MLSLLSNSEKACVIARRCNAFHCIFKVTVKQQLVTLLSVNACISERTGVFDYVVREAFYYINMM